MCTAITLVVGSILFTRVFFLGILYNILLANYIFHPLPMSMSCDALVSQDTCQPNATLIPTCMHHSLLLLQVVVFQFIGKLLNNGDMRRLYKAPKLATLSCGIHDIANEAKLIYMHQLRVLTQY